MANPGQNIRVRLFPVLAAVLSLLVCLKLSGLVMDDGFSLAITPALAQEEGAATPAQTEPEDEKAPIETTSNTDVTQPFIDGTVEEGRRIRLNQPRAEMSSAERAVLESLRKRREELDSRAAALDMRENLLKAAENRIDEKLATLKEFDAKIQASFKEKEDADNERFAGLVTMYENMKSKDAARIFNRLETGIMVNVAKRMSPRKLAPVLADMNPEAAERLTSEIARMSTSALMPAGELEALSTN